MTKQLFKVTAATLLFTISVAVTSAQSLKGVTGVRDTSYTNYSAYTHSLIVPSTACMQAETILLKC